MADRPMTKPCIRCDGCGLVADSKDREPWTAWTSLPVASAFAVTSGLVKPIPCDECAGIGLTYQSDVYGAVALLAGYGITGEMFEALLKARKENRG